MKVVVEEGILTTRMIVLVVARIIAVYVDIDADVTTLLSLVVATTITPRLL
jgi:hypothetical protein